MRQGDTTIMLAKSIQTNNSRKSGIELLRIFAILMVISVHRLGHQTLYSAPQFSISYYILWFIEIVGYKAVDIFFIISGFFGVHQKFKAKKLLLLDFKVFGYCVGFYLLGIAANFYSFNLRDFIRACLPYLGGHYWYYTAYFSLCLLTPWLNKLVFSMSKKNHLLLILLVSGVSTLSIGDAFFTADGYSVFWAMNLYLIGAYLGLYCHNRFTFKQAFARAAACTGFIYLWFVVVGKITQTILGHEVFSTHFMVYRQLPVVLGAVFMVLAFSQLDFKGSLGKRINAISKCTFGVYLIHSCAFMDILFWVKLFPAMEVSQKSWYWVYVLGTIILMYFTCLCIEMARNIVFSRIEKHKVFDAIAEKLMVKGNDFLEYLLKPGENEA